MTPAPSPRADRRRIAVMVAETVSSVAVAGWVGGHAALGAFGARIVFRDLPRVTAATTMTTVFRSFDTLIVVALCALAAATLLRALARGRVALEGADLVATLAAVGLLAVGAAAIGWVHPEIERMFREGVTLGPRFAAMHKFSERLGHAEVGLGLLLYGAFAWTRRPA